MKTKIKSYSKDAVFSELKENCIHAKTGDFIEVTEWYNGEGFDVNVYTANNKNQSFLLTYGEFKLLKKLVKSLDKRDIK